MVNHYKAEGLEIQASQYVKANIIFIHIFNIDGGNKFKNQTIDGTLKSIVTFGQDFFKVLALNRILSVINTDLQLIPRI